MARTTIIMDPTPEGQLSYSRCNNCGVGSETKYLEPIMDLELRIEAGGVVPSGECPDCGALCYLTTSVFPCDVEKIIQRLLIWCEYIGGSEANVWKDTTNLYEKLTGRRIDV